ncbi:MAG: DUF58 domain-containing protein [Methylococcales bacterium]|nr:DUF58 domain-containing protein [Methylococcales bacterium]
MALTRISYLVASIICFIGICSQWIDHDLLKMLWKSMAVLFVVLIFFEGYLAKIRLLNIVLKLPSKIPLGLPQDLNVEIENPLNQVLNIQLQCSFADLITGDQTVLQCEINANEQSTIKQPITLTHLKTYSPGRLHYRIHGRWQLAWWNRPPVDMPQTQAEPHRLKHQFKGVGQSRKGEKVIVKQSFEGCDLMVLRPFQQEDPLKNIDWKATAKRGKPITRIYAEETSIDMVIIIDAGRSSQIQLGNLTRLHHYVNVSARLAELAINQGDRVALVSFAEALIATPLVGGSRGLRAFRSQLQKLHSSHHEFNPLNTVLHVNNMLKRRSLVVIFTEIEDMETSTQLFKATRLLTPKHSPLVASLLDESIEQMKQQQTNSWLDPYCAYAAYDYEATSQNTILHLQRQGAQVIVAKADQLDAMLLSRYESMRYRHMI